MKVGQIFRIGTVHYNWPMSSHASQAFSIAHCTDSEDFPESSFRWMVCCGLLSLLACQ